MGQAIFYYDLGSPECYLAAEQIVGTGSAVPEFQPVLAIHLDGLPAAPNHDSLERRALELGLQPVRWPEPWPPDSQMAMLGATYAKRIGRVVAFSLAAFRQAFAGGRDLGDEATVLLAGAACEMHPSALLKGIGLRSTRQALADATETARRAGVTRLPALVQTSGALP